MPLADMSEYILVHYNICDAGSSVISLRYADERPSPYGMSMPSPT